MSERLPFELEVNGQPRVLELGKCAVFLYRLEPDYDHLFINEDGELPSCHVFRNQDLVRWMAGYAIKRLEDDGLERRTVLFVQEEEEGVTFRELYGWNTPVVEQEEPTESVREMYLEGITEEGGGK